MKIQCPYCKFEDDLDQKHCPVCLQNIMKSGGMRARVSESFGSESLYVYPHLELDAADVFMASAGNVEALRYWLDDTGKRVWGVRINISYRLPLTREDSDQLQAAINLCWKWIEHQQEEADTGRDAVEAV